MRFGIDIALIFLNSFFKTMIHIQTAFDIFLWNVQTEAITTPSNRDFLFNFRTRCLTKKDMSPTLPLTPALHPLQVLHMRTRMKENGKSKSRVLFLASPATNALVAHRCLSDTCRATKRTQITIAHNVAQNSSTTPPCERTCARSTDHAL